jgi:hypothetical protein
VPTAAALPASGWAAASLPARGWAAAMPAGSPEAASGVHAAVTLTRLRLAALRPGVAASLLAIPIATAVGLAVINPLRAVAARVVAAHSVSGALAALGTGIAT